MTTMRPPVDHRASTRDAPTVPSPAAGADAAQGWIVCGVSRSRASRAALRWALREAHRRDARLLAVRVWSAGTQQARARSRRGLVDTVRAAVADTGVRGRTWITVIDGDPRTVLADLGEAAELLVLGRYHTLTERLVA